MREIIFRGKRTDNGEWVQGYLVKGRKAYIVTFYASAYMVVSPSCHASVDFVVVDLETVEQYTGVNDINNVQMFEGDIVDVLIGTAVRFPEPVRYKAVVDFKEGAFGLKYFRGVVEEFTPFASYYKPNVTFTVIGNIHDNKELLEVER